MSFIRKVVNHVPGVGHVLDIASYADGEMGDATMFGYWAAKLGLEVTSKADRKALREASAEWCATHGTPTEARVRKALKL